MTAPGRTRRREEGGAAALEFALVFPLFFLLLYGLVTYGILFGIQLAMTTAAGDAARATVACDPTDAEAHATCVAERARSVAEASLDWLPSRARQAILEGEGVQVELETGAAAGTRVRVTLRYAGYDAAPLLPVLSLPGLGAVPPVPSQLTAMGTILL